MQLWKQRSSTICHLPGWISRKAGGVAHSESEDLRAGSKEDRRRLTFQLLHSGRRVKDFLPPSFCFIYARNELNDTHPHCSELSIFLSLLIQMLISSVPHRHTQK